MAGIGDYDFSQRAERVQQNRRRDRNRQARQTRRQRSKQRQQQARGERKAARGAARTAKATQTAERGMLQRGSRSLVRGGGIVGGLLAEGPDVLSVATSPSSKKLDVANQVASGAGRLATAELGAAGGAALGSLAGPVGTLAGGTIGGIAGYIGGDKAIDYGRRLLGVDERDPAEQQGTHRNLVKQGIDASVEHLAGQERTTTVPRPEAIGYRGSRTRQPGGIGAPAPEQGNEQAIYRSTGAHGELSFSRHKTPGAQKVSANSRLSSYDGGAATNEYRKAARGFQDINDSVRKGGVSLGNAPQIQAREQRRRTRNDLRHASRISKDPSIRRFATEALTHMGGQNQIATRANARANQPNRAEVAGQRAQANAQELQNQLVQRQVDLQQQIASLPQGKERDRAVQTLGAITGKGQDKFDLAKVPVGTSSLGEPIEMQVPVNLRTGQYVMPQGGIGALPQGGGNRPTFAQFKQRAANHPATRDLSADELRGAYERRFGQ